MKPLTPTIVYTTADAAPKLHPNLSPRTLERWRRNGTGPKFVQIGRRVGYTDEAIEDFKRQQTRTHTVEGR
jgi:predicted site-specific integrase-resolvase